MWRLRSNKKGVSYAVTAMLGLVIVAIIVANVFIWNYQMNQVDWEKTQEKVTLDNVIRRNTSSYNPTGYNLLQSTRLTSGSLNNLVSDDEIYLTTRSFASATSTTTKTDYFITYRSNSSAFALNSPKSRVWNGDTAIWSGESEMASSNSPILSTRVAYCPLQQRCFEKIVVALSEDGFLNVHLFDGSSWISTEDLGQVWMSKPLLPTRPYDVAYESTSGKILLVYETVVGGATRDLAYRTWSISTGWSPERYFDDVDHSSKITVTFVSLISVPNSNEIGVAYIDSSNNDANAMIWDGYSFTGFIELTGNVSTATEECVSICAQTDGAVVALAGEGELVRWSRYTTSWSPLATFDVNSGSTNAMNWLRLIRSQTDRLMLISVDGASYLTASVLDENSVGNRQWENAAESMGALTSNNSVSAIRFTAQATKSVSNILVFVHAVQASPTYRFGIESSTSGYLPNGVYVGGSTNYAVASPTTTGWLNLTLPYPATLNAGTVYHITVRYDNGTIGASNYIALRRLGPNLNNFRPKENVVDSWLNTISGTTIQNRDPIFILQYNESDSFEAMPYDNVASHNIYGANWYSEKWIQNETNTIVGLNLPLTKTGNPADNLYLVLRSETDSQDMASITFSPADITTTLQWCEKYFASPVYLVSGKSYRLILRSPASTATNYFTARSLTTSGPGALTYDGINSYYSASSNSGTTWTDAPTQDLTSIMLLQNPGTMGWIIQPTLDTNLDTHAARCADFAWDFRAQPSFRNQGIIVYGTTAGQITWRRFRAPNYVTAATNVAMGTNVHPWIQMKSNPRTVANDTISLGAVLEATTFDLGAIKWDGTALTIIGATTFSSDTVTSDYECFDMEFATFGEPTEFRIESEFSGTSDTGNWTQLTWSIDAAWSTSNVAVTFQLYDQNLGAYTTGGDGYISYISSATPSVDEARYQTILTAPTRFRDASGQWKMKMTGVKNSSSQFDSLFDAIELCPPNGGPYFLITNSGTVTSHIISLWITDSSSHQRYDVSIYVNSGQNLLFHENDIDIPNGPFIVKIVTDKGNLALFSGS